MPVAVTHKLEVLLLKIIFRKSPAFDGHTFPNFPKLPRHVKSPPTAVLPLPGSSWCPPLSRLLPCRAPRSADRTRQKQNFPSLLQGHNLVVTGERWDVIERRSSGDRPDERGGGQTCEPALRSGAAQLQGAQRSSALVSRCLLRWSGRARPDPLPPSPSPHTVRAPVCVQVPLSGLSWFSLCVHTWHRAAVDLY